MKWLAGSPGAKDRLKSRSAFTDQQRVFGYESSLNRIASMQHRSGERIHESLVSLDDCPICIAQGHLKNISEGPLKPVHDD
jgi:hypothetical protein